MMILHTEMTAMNDFRVLVVEDEAIAKSCMAEFLRDNGYQVDEAADGLAALRSLESREYALVITDVQMPGLDGMQLLEFIKSSNADIEVIMTTGYASVEDAVSAVQMGAFNYLSKPIRLDELGIMVDRALERRQLFLEVGRLKNKLGNDDFPGIVGQSPSIMRLKKEIRQIASADCTVLITGDTGTGKELVARALHAQSNRKDERFLAVNCATLSDELLANELFGHEKAAFTGAGSLQKGLLEAANGGTFFLDEVGEMSLGMQASLLRVLETRAFMRVGGTREIPVDVRIIAATNRNLQGMVESGAFRADLYYRLNIITVHSPSLVERKEDIPLLAHYFLNKHCTTMDKKIARISDPVLRTLCSHSYPGNVRELSHLIERAVVLCSGDAVLPAHLPAEFKNTPDIALPMSAQVPENGTEPEVYPSIEEHERSYLAKVLEDAGGSAATAAKLLNMNRGTLWRKLKRFGLIE